MAVAGAGGCRPAPFMRPYRLAGSCRRTTVAHSWRVAAGCIARNTSATRSKESVRPAVCAGRCAGFVAGPFAGGTSSGACLQGALFFGHALMGLPALQRGCGVFPYLCSASRANLPKCLFDLTFRSRRGGCPPGRKRQTHSSQGLCSVTWLAVKRAWRPSGTLCSDALCQAIGKRSSNMMASWLLTACHSRTVWLSFLCQSA